MKKIILILLSLLMIFTFLSCDSDPPEEPGNLCLITYDKNGGEFVSSPFTKARKDTYVSIPEIRKTGYTLESWKGAEKASDGTWGFTMKGYDVTLKAIWNAESHKISYDLNGGRWTTNPPIDSALMDQDVYIDEKPSLDGSHFVKWTSDDVKLDLTKYGYHFKMPSHSVSLRAEYSADRYTISYDLNGGDFVEEQWYPESAYKDEEVFILSSPVKTGYIFDGWESDGISITQDDDIYSFTMPSKSITLKAKWKADIIELRWYGIGAASVEDKAETGTVITLPTVVKENYKFKEWRIFPNTLSEDKTKFTVQPIDDKNKYMTIKAIWEGEEYTITYNNVEDATWTETPKYTGKLFSEVIIPELNKEGFVVTGWTSSDPNDEIKKMLGEDDNRYSLFRTSGGNTITLTPVYEVVINYNFVHDNVKILEGYDKTAIPYSMVRLPKCECDGYRFLGWKNSSTGAQTVEINGEWFIPVSNTSVTVEALWQKVNTIKFYDGDELMYKYDIVDGNYIKMPYPNTTGPKGSVFITWYNMDAGPGNYMQVKQKYTPSTSVSVKAVWGYPLEGKIVYDDPNARDENIVYTFFNWLNEWTPYDPSKIGDPNFDAYYYSIELKNGATITKDRYYVKNTCIHNISPQNYITWTYYKDGKYVHEKVGTNKREIGDGRYNTQLVLGLIKEGEEAKRGIANINPNSPYTKPRYDTGEDYTIWAFLQGLNQRCVYHDWYIPSRDEAYAAMEKLSTPGMKIWTSTESDQELEDNIIGIHYDKLFNKIYAADYAKVPFGTDKDIWYMRSF